MYLGFIPGALLEAYSTEPSPDLAQISTYHQDTKQYEIVPERYYQLYTDRFLPVLVAFNQIAKTRGTRGLVTVPGIGAGYFKGTFESEAITWLLFWTFSRLSSKKGHLFPHIDIWLSCRSKPSILSGNYTPARPQDPDLEKFETFYQKYKDQTDEVVKKPALPRIFVQSYEKTKAGGVLHQLDPAILFQEALKKEPYVCQFEDAKVPEYGTRMSLVAWDHFSWPGNDWTIGSRISDDGVKGAATSAL